MKSSNRLILIIIATFIIASMACTGAKKNKETKENLKTEKLDEDLQKVKEETIHYQCPMKCEGVKTYTDKGKCPLCKMDLKEIVNV